MAPLHIFIATGEHSGDALGAKLIRAVKEREPLASFTGVGGEQMRAAGLDSLFPISDIAVMGVLDVAARLRTILARIRATAEAAIRVRPDALVIIDSPDFTHRVARRVRASLPDLPVIDYVSPTVWAWRPGRAKTMARYIDRVLALLPFEPAEHARLGGPSCVYVGHPLVERLVELRPAEGERAPLGAEVLPRLLVLPGSRAGVVRRHLDAFGEVITRLNAGGCRFELTLPTVPELADEIRDRVARWSVAPRVVLGEAERLQAFRMAHAALAGSGTVTLELALSGVPMVAAYRLDPVVRILALLIRYRMHSVLLPNLITGDNSIPEFVRGNFDPEAMAEALAPLLVDGPERRRQLEAFARLEALMSLGSESPSTRAARLVLETIRDKPRGLRANPNQA